MAIYPIFVLLHPFLPAFELFGLTLVFFGEYDHLDRVVHHEGELQNFSPDIFAALRALLSPNEALGDALVAERMTTDGDPASHDQVHADWTGESLHFFERLECGFFLLLYDLPEVISLLVFLGNDHLGLSLLNLVILSVSQNLSSQCVLYFLNLVHLIRHSEFRG